ncbi:hypothetical protein CN582_24770 [Bacillus wiedmannii]|uniref:hypothetical protein n=1 Tax=Bacillus wiedmannii TaxID=1890302 RepID=UPI000BF5F3A8|nr:hypothetical protein [Bacillus wiedmannii]PEP92729.1 hypothetical protein CN582_24770 [Bacillus wiedmannii]
MGGCDFKQCHAILKNPQDTLILNNTKSLRWNVYHYIERMSYQEIQNKKSNGFKFGFSIPIEGLPTPFVLDSNFSSEDFSKLQQAIREEKAGYLSEDIFQLFIKQVTNSEVFKAWSKCMETMIKTCAGKGLQSSYIYIGKQIQITLGYLKINDIDPYPKVESIYIPKNAICASKNIEVGTIIKNELIIVIEKNSDEEGVIVINTDKGGISVPLQEEKTPAPSPTPTPHEDPPITITNSELQELKPKLYRFVIDKWISTYGDLGPDGFIRVEELSADKSIIHFKIIFHYARRCRPFGALEQNAYMEDTLDLGNLDSLKDRDTSVTFPAANFCRHDFPELIFYISTKELADFILCIVNR